jgi:hypothetical protein
MIPTHVFFFFGIFLHFSTRKIWFQHIQSSCYEKNQNEKGTFL